MRRIRSHLSFANVLSLIALFVALGGTALASVIITSNSQVAQNTISGHKPPAGQHSNLIAGSVNGQDVADNSVGGADVNESSLTGNARALVYNAAATDITTSPSQPKTIATVGPYTIKGDCTINFHSFAPVTVNLVANGPAGTADTMFSHTENDATDLGTQSPAVSIPANTNTVIATTTATVGSGGAYERIGGTAMLKTGSTLVQVEFNAVADPRSSPSCFIYGTATRGT
jgi:hypothetical protein